jgi:hypothetical protein
MIKTLVAEKNYAEAMDLFGNLPNEIATKAGNINVYNCR